MQLLEQLQLALRRRERAAQNDIIQQLIEMRPPLGDQWRQVSNVALNNGEHSLARQAIDCFVQSQGCAPVALYHKAVLLEQCGELEAAYKLLCALPENVPDVATRAYSLGVEALFLGRAQEAKDRLELVTKLRPELGVAWLMLATSSDMANEPELADQVLAAEPRMALVTPNHRAPYYCALGKVHADRGEHALAFAAIARSAEIMKALVRYNAEGDRRNAATAVRSYTAESLSALSSLQQECTSRTIFVTGLPRSGTTLIEQILVSHSAVGDGAELNRLLLLAQEVGGISGDALRRYLEKHEVGNATRLWHHWMEERFPGSGRVIDKSLTTTRLLGLAAALLPEAPLIWLTRNPLDCAWSCFRTFFAGTMPWAHDLADIATHFRIEEELLRRWQDILGERLLVVPYEALATDPDAWIPQVLEHCGLPVEAAVFVPHKTSRAVKTASAMQVRRPIDRRGIGSAEPYREFMAPFLDAYSR